MPTIAIIDAHATHAKTLSYGRPPRSRDPISVKERDSELLSQRTDHKAKYSLETSY